MARYGSSERHRITQAVLRKHITVMRLNYVLTILDLLLKYLDHHSYWIRDSHDPSGIADEPNNIERPRQIHEATRQSWWWWIAIARQELNLGRVREVNQIVVGRHLERCALPMEPWTAYRRLTMTCAATHYFDQENVECITQKGPAVWDIVAPKIKAFSGGNIAQGLVRRALLLRHRIWYKKLREEYQLEMYLLTQIAPYYDRLDGSRERERQRQAWQDKYVKKVFGLTTPMYNAKGRTDRSWHLEYKEKLRRVKTLRKDMLGLIGANMFLEKVWPHAVRKLEELQLEWHAIPYGRPERRVLQQRVKAWNEIVRTIDNGYSEANAHGWDNWAIYEEAKKEYEEALKKMYDFHLFLPYELVEDRVWFVRPRVPENAMRLTTLDYVPRKSDDDIIAEQMRALRSTRVIESDLSSGTDDTDGSI